ncbi:hypothetical protein RND71_033706 [Anisodus tanguticus]|uniref:Uncharacterized protein n=1 Tax=Anisodus tanguticus TaxID=243964 RepID=A0AAE1RAP9_9SOLA|nr:hypothetical protein RND71_033706 [Anisodus tanguticus]
MGNLKKNLFTLLPLSFLFFLSSSNEFHPKNLGSASDYSKAPHHHDEYDHIKNSEELFFLKQAGEGGWHMTNKKMKTLSTSTYKMKTRSLDLKRKRGKNNSDWSRKRTYSAMLPKEGDIIQSYHRLFSQNIYPCDVIFNLLKQSSRNEQQQTI